MRRGTGLAAAAVLALAGCRSCRKDPLEPPAPRPKLVERLPSAPAGHFAGGAFVDDSFPLSILVPGGWAAEVGDIDSPVRLTLHHAATGATLEYRAWRAETAEPGPRERCTWTFDDTGHYSALRVPGEVLAATCTPADPSEPRRLGWFIARDGVAFSAEALLPAGKLLDSKSAVEDALASARFR